MNKKDHFINNDYKKNHNSKRSNYNDDNDDKSLVDPCDLCRFLLKVCIYARSQRIDRMERG